MSKMTDRISTSVAADQARKHYETEQQNKLPSMIVPLVSGGKIYPKDHPLHEGKIEMRYMTAYDEDILTNVSYLRDGVMLDRLIESVSLTKFDIDDMSTFDKDGLLLYARILSYGKEYTVSVTDPKTKNKLERVVDLETIQAKPFKLSADNNGEFEYKTKKHTIKFTYNIKSIESLTPSEFCKTVITQIDDSRTPEAIEYFTRYQFLALESKKFRSYYVDNAPGLDLNTQFEGENGGTFETRFPISSDFFWF
jgi:hypothetical protein